MTEQRAILQLEKQIKQDPKNISLLSELALLHYQAKNYAHAVKLLKTAIGYHPNEPFLYNNLGKVYKAQGMLNEAIAVFREALKIRLNYSYAYNNIGVCLFQQGLIKEASEHFAKAIRIDPNYAAAQLNLANSYIDLDQPHKAIEHYLQVLKLDLDNISCLHNLGILYTKIGEYKEAIKYLNRALNYTPDNLDLKFHLAVILSSNNKLEHAISYYLQIIEQDPSYAMAHHNLATIYLSLEDPKRAKIHYEAAYNLDPNNKTAKHMLDSLNGNTTDAPAEQYVENLFDQYANNYDQHLSCELKYQVPYVLRQIISKDLEHITSPCLALDLGCGTGQAALYFNDIADRAIGVDISQKMLNIAKTKDFYQKVYKANVVAFTEQIEQHNKYNLVIAADLLVYLGSLAKLFKNISMCLKENSLFVFSTEKLDEKTKQDYVLQQTGRYAHNIKYLEEQLSKNNFKVLHKELTTLRLNHQQPINGWVICALLKS